ncbi:hypothetical protein A2W13_00500 [Candidatus Woesebacteria bacterium RBG_16_36_11]|uniref:Uncharacterized protein n=3 Tax=Candidatus Woeseibacteriota TaxID=1752722 RepID=A0A1F7X815_9BACT|nr:MAG: hypothetical protein A2Z67_01285 [Candidatus Woesebacteria bacterium RBG_13_36_22]OGM10909.1 MAG: hypothetical protein A2W13_00500 [Candidatus Woesebacteria bacterium RBG_16_36_11]OGM16879.1 MAG: hypothetical protein A2V55_02895 [Candidatus Woesebacteria bacterium RBG_19FT_COMBO_37_29]
MFFIQNNDKTLKHLTGGLRTIPIKENAEYRLFLEDFKSAKKTGKPIEIWIMCCPDYSYSVDSSGWGEYDYKSLGFGPGMMCKAYSQAIIEIVKLISKNKIDGKISLYYGDIESKDKERLKQLNIDEYHFLGRIRGSYASSVNYIHDLNNSFIGSLPHKTELTIKSFGMMDNIYNQKTNNIAEKKIKLISSKELKNVALLRKDVIENTYKKRYETNRSFFLDKAKEQIMDRLIVGSAASQERERGKLINILTVTIPELIVYFNFMNNLHIPILTLGKNKK